MRTRVPLRSVPALGLLMVACSRPVTPDDPESRAVEVGGAGETTASVEQPADARSGAVPEVHVVQPGETLFSIAWRYRLNMRDLILWNELADPDLILVDQRLLLFPPGSGDTVAEDPESDTAAIERPPTTTMPTSTTVAPWIWPVRGPIVADYGSTADTGDGIGIGGEMGTDVRAAAGGEVAYAGSGLAAYGNLVILRHRDMFLSAYGHNDALLVAEGDAVAQGQVIATMGMGPQRIPQLHFELRRDGRPVNPLGYLPGAAATR